MDGTVVRRSSKGPRVTVVIPTFDRPELTERAVVSALEQSLRELEVIVVDDGSRTICEDVRKLDARVRYVCLADNRGPASARNRGIWMARGELIAFLDSDDVWLEHHLAVVLEGLERYPQAVLATTSPGFKILEGEPALSVVDALPRLVLINPVGFVPGVVVRRSAIRDVGGFDERLRIAEDDELWLRLALGGDFCLVRRRTFVRELQPDSLCGAALRSGAYLEPLLHVARCGLRSVAATSRSDRAELVAAARARLMLVETAWALRKGDVRRASASLALGYALLPSLADSASLVRHYLRTTSSSFEEHLRWLDLVVEIWPSSSDAASAELRCASRSLAALA